MFVVRKGRSINNEPAAESRYLGEEMGADLFSPGLSSFSAQGFPEAELVSVCSVNLDGF